MQPVISGFAQADILAVCKEKSVHLDFVDVAILRWIADCHEAFPTKNIDGQSAFSLSYAQFSADVLFAPLKRTTLFLRIQKLAEQGFLCCAEKNDGFSSFYRMGENLLLLLHHPTPGVNAGSDDGRTDEEIAVAKYEEWLAQEPEMPASYRSKCERYHSKSERGVQNVNGSSSENEWLGDSPNICTNLVRTLEPSNNNQPSKSQEITSVLRPTDNNQLSISQELSDTYPVEKDPKENPYFVRVKEKGKKKAPKGPEMTTLLLPILDESTLAAPLKEALRGWLEYKAERKEKYVPTGFKSLLMQVKKNAEKYGDDAVIDLIDECKANSYQGIIWDKLARLPAKAQQPKLEAEHAASKRPDPEIEWRKSKFAPRDYSAGLRAISTSELREYPKNSGKYVPYWMIPGYMQEYPAGSGKYVPYYDLPGYDPEHDENHWW